MKNLKKTTAGILIILIAVAAGMASCKKDSNGSNISVASDDPKAFSIDPVQGSAGNVLAITGEGLGGVASIVFDNGSVPAAFNPTFNTDAALLFRVPDTANGGPQNIIVTNTKGKSVTVPFKVIALAVVTAASGSDFVTGTVITLTGNNLADVTKVVLSGTTDAATIISKSKKELVISMPSTAVFRAKLDITNLSGVSTTSLEFISITNNFAFFAEDLGVMQNWSWCSASGSSTAFAVTGTKSLFATYTKDAWQALSLHKDDPKIVASNYTYLTFWVKGGTADTQLDVNSENGGSTNTITVPAGVWTYFKMPILGFMNGVLIERLDFKMHGPGNTDQTVYFDNILLVK
jgi:hypothetical protein